jgi:hypothetical protein
VTAEELWKPHEIFGSPLKVGEWMYAGRVPLAVRVLKSDTLYGTGDYEDDPDVCNDRAVECYYLEFQGAGEERWCSMSGAFLSLEDIERYWCEHWGDSLRWCGPAAPR